MSDREFFRRYLPRPRPDVLGVVVSILALFGLIGIPSCLSSNDSISVDRPHHVRAPLPKAPVLADD